MFIQKPALQQEYGGEKGKKLQGIHPASTSIVNRRICCCKNFPERYSQHDDCNEHKKTTGCVKAVLSWIQQEAYYGSAEQCE